ncbi:3H domain-containing protein [Dolosicoccus paucivorans]
MLSTNERRKEVLTLLQKSSRPITGSALAEMFDVSRQVIVQDVAILKAENHPILSTYRGYTMISNTSCSRIIKVRHTDDEIEKELNAAVDVGAQVKDVFIWHKAYGKIMAELNIKSRKDVQNLLQDMATGISRPLKQLTDGYHYHTVEADKENVLDEVEDAWKKMGIYVPE